MFAPLERHLKILLAPLFPNEKVGRKGECVKAKVKISPSQNKDLFEDLQACFCFL